MTVSPISARLPGKGLVATTTAITLIVTPTLATLPTEKPRIPRAVTDISGASGIVAFPTYVATRPVAPMRRAGVTGIESAARHHEPEAARMVVESPESTPSARRSFLRGISRTLGGRVPPRLSRDETASDLELALLDFTRAVQRVAGADRG